MPAKKKYHNQKCSVSCCERNAKSKGFCIQHYKVFWRTGNPITKNPCYHEPIEIKFWRYVKIKTYNGCWEWLARKDKDGYGSIRDGVKNKRAHRVSYELNIGPIPENKMILHSCNNPSCVNPNHLRIGNQFDNMADRKYAGNEPIGEIHHNNKFSDDIVRQVLATSGTYKSISESFGISISQVGNIKRRDQRKLTTKGELF